MGTFKIRPNGRILYAVYCHGSETFRVKTGVRINPEDWDHDHLKKSAPAYEAKNALLNTVLSELIDTVNKIRYSGEEPTVAAVRKAYGGVPDCLEKTMTFWTRKEEYMAYKRTKLAPNSIRNTLQMFRSLKDYEKEFDYQMDPVTFDRAEFERYVMYLSLKCKLRDNYVSKQARQLRAFLHWAYPDGNFKYVNHPEFSTEVIALKETELHILIDAELGDLYLPVRDLFVFLCLTGMRFSDSQRVDKAWQDEGVFKFRQKKTGGIAMPPIFNTTKDILKRWRGHPPRMWAHEFNYHLKELFKDLGLNRPIQVSAVKCGRRVYSIHPLSEVISSHVGRKTFITLALSKGIPLQDVMRMSGHLDYRSMRSYIEISREHVKEIAKKWKI